MKVYRATKSADEIVSNCYSKIYSTRLNDLPFKENSTFFYLLFSDAVKLLERTNGDDYVIVEMDIPVDVLVDSIGIGHYMIDDYYMDEYDAFEFLVDNSLIKPRNVNVFTKDSEVYKKTVDYVREFSYDPIYKPELIMYDEIKDDKEKIEKLLYRLKDRETAEYTHIFHDRKMIKTIKP